MGLGGAIIGGIIGSMFGGWGGAIVGSLIGGAIGGGDKSNNTVSSDDGKEACCDEATQRRALIALFKSFGCLAKADGIVSQDEADYVSNVLSTLQISDKSFRETLINAFNAGKRIRSCESIIQEVERCYQSHVYPTIMESYCAIVLADGVITPEEKSFLETAEVTFNLPGFSQRFFRKYQGGSSSSSSSSGSSSSGSGRRRSYQSSSSSDSGSSSGSRTRARASGSASAQDYYLLGVEPSASDSDVKSAYRKKIIEFHPDKIQGKGLSESFIAFATDQTNKINAAYERICKDRGIR